MTRTTLHLLAVTPAMRGALSCAGGLIKDQVRELERGCAARESQGEPGPRDGSGPAVMVVDQPVNANVSVDDDTVLVGEEVALGLNRVEPDGDLSQWDRLSTLSGESESYVADDLPSDPTYVDILATDFALSSEDRGTWRKAE